MVRSLPAHAITPVGRIDGSGTTSLFSSYLSFAGSWALGNRTLVAFPACVTRVKGTPGIIAAVQSTPFAIGCAGLLCLPGLAGPARACDEHAGSARLQPCRPFSDRRRRRYAELGSVRSAKLPLVAIANVAGSFTLPDSGNFASAVPRRLAVPDVLGDGWYSLAVGSSGTALFRVRAQG